MNLIGIARRSEKEIPDSLPNLLIGMTLPQEVMMRTCKYEGCNRKHKALGYCKRHYTQVTRRGYAHGDATRVRKMPNEVTICGDTAYLNLYNHTGEVIARTMIDTDMVEKCSQHVWVLEHEYASTKSINGRKEKLHRFLLGLSHGDGIEVDHANHNTLDNRMRNLRVCTKNQNRWNTLPSRKNKSGYKGVHFRKRSNKWMVRIGVNNKRIYLGDFQTKEEAAKIYNEAARKLHGEFAYLNEVA
jgi:hypothetical protein